MRTSYVFSFLTAVIFPLIAANDASAEKVSTKRVSAPIVAISGTDSDVQKASYQRITTSKEWAEVWARHLGTSVDDYYRPLFEVDFNRCLVVVMFLGERIQARRIEVESVSENTESVVVRFNELGYAIANQKSPNPERPYAFVVLPTTDKQILVEEKMWSKEDEARGRPPNWTDRARLRSTRTVSSKP